MYKYVITVHSFNKSLFTAISNLNKFGSQNVIGPTYDKYNNAKANHQFGIFLYLVKTNYF